MVCSGERTVEIDFTPGLSLREILEATEIPIRTGCNGNGSCGLCRVRITSGKVQDPSQQEMLVINSSRSEAKDVRLACYVRPELDLGIEICGPAQDATWKIFPCNHTGDMLVKPVLAATEMESGNCRGAYGVAVDLGTSQISISILELDTGRRIAGRYGTNPQAAFGADVMTRLVAATGSVEKARAPSHPGRSCHRRRARGHRQPERGRPRPGDPTCARRKYSDACPALWEKLPPPYPADTWTGTIDCLPDETAPMAAEWGIHSATIDVLPPFAGFVGSDLLAGVQATRMMELDRPALLIDFGTNSEIALWDGHNLFLTSAAGGPAFEGSGMQCGMPAEAGAICQVRFRSHGAECATIAGVPARGICGTGLVDLIANLLRAGHSVREGPFLTGSQRRFCPYKR